MDVDLVEEKGRALKADADKLSQLTGQIESVVRRLPAVWDGQDARDFVTVWWPKHKKTLALCAEAVAGLGQAALNNASEQRTASGLTGTAGNPTNGGSPSADGGGTTPVGLGAGALGAATGAATAAAVTRDANAQAFLAKWKGNPIDFDHAYGRQCFDVFQQYSHDVAGVPPNVSIATDSNNACDIYKHYATNGTAAYYDQVGPDQTPQAGDIVVYDATKYNSAGHVALVVTGGADFQVLQQNGLHPTTTVATVGDGPTAAGTVLGYLRPKN